MAANLLGRGGAAFPTGRKWEAVAGEAAQPHFLVCNADESEPGTFKDRVLLEEDPFAIVEAMTIAGYATGCSRGFIYIRGEYPLAAARIQQAIEAARAAGMLGDEHPRPRGGLRYRSPPRRAAPISAARKRALQLARGQARRAAIEAAVSRAGRLVRQADRRQQRRNARQRARHRARRRRRVGRRRHEGVDRHAALLPVGPRRAARAVRGAVRRHARRPARPGGRGGRRPRAAGHPARRRGWHLRRPRRAVAAADLRRRPRRPAPRSARAWSWCSTTPPSSATRCCASRSSWPTSRAASAFPAE